MKTTEKQILANRKNAQKSTGPVTQAGKKIASRNSLKHGLLAKEIVINHGEGAEDRQAFDTLLADLTNQFRPQGSLEEILVEKIAVAYWRLRRAHRYETGLIREKLDNATDNFYNNEEDYSLKKQYRQTDEAIESEITRSQERIDIWNQKKTRLNNLRKEGADLKQTYELDEIWRDFAYKYYDLVKDFIGAFEEKTPEFIRQVLYENDWSDEMIWDRLIKLCDDEIYSYGRANEVLAESKVKNKMALQVSKKLHSIPDGSRLDKLLKYEGTIEKQFYKAVSELERLQRLRGGDKVPPPVKLDVEVNEQ